MLALIPLKVPLTSMVSHSPKDSTIQRRPHAFYKKTATPDKERFNTQDTPTPLNFPVLEKYYPISHLILKLITTLTVVWPLINHEIYANAFSTIDSYSMNNAHYKNGEMGIYLYTFYQNVIKLSNLRSLSNQMGYVDD